MARRLITKSAFVPAPEQLSQSTRSLAAIAHDSQAYTTQNAHGGLLAATPAVVFYGLFIREYGLPSCLLVLLIETCIKK
jgi:hypothetical protein